MAQDTSEPAAALASDNYTFESIDVAGVDFLEVAASSDFEDYAGYTKSADGEKDIAFTLMDGVFTTYDFPIQGAKGYIVNVPEARNFTFVSAPWTDPPKKPLQHPLPYPQKRGRSRMEVRHSTIPFDKIQRFEFNAIID